jgi:large conductance mechanosensitive channel
MKRISEFAEMGKKGLVTVRELSMIDEFKDFLREYKVIGLAVGFVMATAATSFVKSIVDNAIMPLITPFIPNGAWQTATVSIGPVVIGWGALLGALINFIILAWAVFVIAKLVLREMKVAKK